MLIQDLMTPSPITVSATRHTVPSVGYIVWFLKARLFEVGPEISRKEWLYFILMLGLVMVGTINIRMAEMRARNQQTMPLIDPSRIKK